ncbi:MAG: c-type cytochrome biogenesis protein CcmI [Tagaea sp.]|nr:c-type cytochrome biogenesis protein CcmI [Tagaea sp.]
MIWILAIALTAATSAYLLWPILRPGAQARARADYDMEIYRDQLTEVDRDLARGQIGEAEAKAARAEIGRRLIAASDEAREVPVAAPLWRKAALALGIALPLAGLAIYADRGSPAEPNQPLAERRLQGPSEGELELRRIADFARAMRERAARDPNDLEAWVRLAQASQALNLPGEALAAWRKADELSGGPPEIAGSLGEAAVAAANGTVTPEAERAFARVLAASPGDPRARYYAALAKLQAGRAREAVQAWFDLLAASPPDAPWVGPVRARLDEAAREARIDPRTLRASPGNPRAEVTLGPPAIVPPGGEAVAALPADARAAAIRTMVEGLAARLETQPDDLDGWRRLARAWRVLGEGEKALTAYARTAAIVPDRPDVLADYADALLDLVPETERLPEPGRAAIARLLDLEPTNPTALWLAGQEEALAGNRLAATALWQRLLAAIPADSPARADLTRRIEALRRAE